MAEGDTLANAVIGGIASILLAFVPFSPVLGGIVAGYLQGGDRGAGLRVGAYAGVVAAIPLVLFLLFGSLLAGVVLAGDALLGVGAVFGFGFFVLIVIGGLYTVALGAVGGWLGNYVKYDTDLV